MERRDSHRPPATQATSLLPKGIAGIDVAHRLRRECMQFTTDAANARSSVRDRSATFGRQRWPRCDRLANLSDCLGNLKLTCVYFSALDPSSLVSGVPT